jgi:gamma-glutamyl-gamma-aminobutyrate hydrolase PuuD
MRPKVAITLGARTRPDVVEQYVQYMHDSGADTLVVMPGNEIPWAQIDGLVLGGGADVDPAVYGQRPHPRTEVEPDRDALELPAARHAMDNHIPTLGICRGFQLLNVVLGGSLVQHLDGHGRDPGGRSGQHRARVEPGSRLHEVLGKPDVLVNSSHHQAVRVENLAPGLKPCATTEDGLIEAFEADGILAVQWHPERVDELDPENRHIGQAFVASLRARARASV